MKLQLRNDSKEINELIESLIDSLKADTERKNQINK